jgi:5,10-methylenetetrahydrofolate reductase
MDETIGRRGLDVINGVTSCPKRMTFGPCGGVLADGACEMRPEPCVFGAVVPWPGPATPRVAVTPPLVLTDLSVPPGDAAALSATVAALASSCDAVLIGEHQDRPGFPPGLLARIVSAAGGTPWVTLACRDRNRVVLEQELLGLRHDGLATVLCVTGDGRAYDVRPEVTQVFDLDGTRLAALAASLGLPTAVVETPTAAPTVLRPARLVQKQLAGAGIAVLNHTDSSARLSAFMAAARQAGLVIPVVAAVALYTDARSAAALGALPGLDLSPNLVEDVVNAADPVAAGIDAAVAHARELLAIQGIAGVNLSGMASGRSVAFAAEVQAEVGRRIKSDHAP